MFLMDYSGLRGTPGETGVIEELHVGLVRFRLFFGHVVFVEVVSTGHTGSQAPQSMHSSGWMQGARSPL
jgi:hypothetical protein